MQANPHAEPNLKVWSVLRHNPIERAIILPRKSSKHPIVGSPVPQTDTRGRVEYTQALERVTVKELGKLTL